MAIPCACVGIIIFWVHVIRGGGKGYVMANYPPNTEDELSKKNKPANGRIFCIRWLHSLIQMKKTKLISDRTSRDPIIRKK